MVPVWKKYFAVIVVTAILAGCTVKDNVTEGDKTTIAFAALPHAALAHIAQQQGYFLQEGLQVTPNQQPFGKAALDEVLAGRANFATVAETPFMFAVMKGAKLAIIATIQTSRRNEAIVALKEKGITSSSDLKGKRIGVTIGTTSDFFSDAFLGAHGISREDVTLIDLKPADIPDALARGYVDAVSVFVPHLTETQKVVGNRGVTFHDENVYTETFNIVAKQDYIRENQRIVEKVLRGLVAAEKFVRKNPTSSQMIVAESIGVDLPSVRDIWFSNNLRVTLDQSLLLALEDEAEWAIRNSLTPATKVPDFLDFVYLDGLLAVNPDAMAIVK